MKPIGTFIKKITAFAVVTTILLLACTTSTLASGNGFNAERLAEAVLYGENYSNSTFHYSVKSDEPVIVIINPNNPEEIGDDYHDIRYDTVSKQDFIQKLTEITNERIAKIKTYQNDTCAGIIFDEPTNRDCTRCPARALERAKGTFYQDYVYNFWTQFNEVYATASNHNIPSVEAFFAAEGIPLNNVVPKVTPTPTPVPTAPPKAVEKLNSIKNSTNVENTLYVLDTDGILTLAVNGEIVKFPDVQPFIDNHGRTQIPVRALAETFNCDVNWDGRISTAIINGNGKLITIAIDSTVITVNGVDTVMDTTAMLKDERTCVPIRYIAEALGLTVKYEKV